MLFIVLSLLSVFLTGGNAQSQMSVVPRYLRLLDELTPASIFDQDFGLGLFDDDLLQPRLRSLFLCPSRAGYLRPWALSPSGSSNIVSTKDEFKVNLDVQQFKPEEISVKVVDKALVIEGKHEERQDEHGYISREFKRRYVLPNDVDAENVASSLSSDGVLIIQAPKKASPPENERQIPIVQTNKPAVTEKKEEKESSKGEGDKKD